tara:strand:+ start:1054 stop:1317 length:264 start_codon:yes stop_codon:yes gene_type:complete
MTDKQMNYIADRVANTVINFIAAEQIKFDAEYVSMHDIIADSSEQALMNKLSALFTELDATLKLEDYTKCAEIQHEIIKIESKLKNL